MNLRSFILLLLLAAPYASAERYALLLSDAPALRGDRTQLMAAQGTLRRELARRNFAVGGSVQRVLNAVFVQAPPDRVDELRALPGVAAVVKMRRRTLKLDKAVQLVDAPAAWNALGGTGNAGAGVKIAIIDTGIDQNHPAFQDPSLQTPPGYPICKGADCAFTSNKVIVARSYIAQEAAGTPPNPAADSRPDDFLPRDHVGHGTALGMIAAGHTNSGPSDTITGMAPKAWLGNYKIFGSPGLNDGATSDAIILALEDALNDGMNVAVLSLGGPALSGPLDTGAICGETGNNPCDPEAVAVENVIRMGLTVVAAAGNEGDIGIQLPTLGTVDSPGYAPSVIAVGATTNGHVFINSVRVPGNNVPAGLSQIAAIFGDGPLPAAPVTAPMRDVTATGDNGLACSPLRSGSLTGTLALVQRGTCTFAQKVAYAQQAGAVGVIIIQQQGMTTIFTPSGLQNVGIPAAMIGASDGAALRSFVAANPDHPGTLDPGLFAVDVSTYNEMTTFSSRGPTAGSASLKPDLAAVGQDIYMSTEKYDPEGEMYDPTGYTVADGTSFSTPMVAGAVALVKQGHPGFTPGQLKSAVVNTATQDVTENGLTASVTAVGGGKLDAFAALETNVTVEPATLSFGAIGRSTLPVARPLAITNTSSAPVNLTLAIQATTRDTLGRLTLDRGTLVLGAGQSATVTVTLGGSTPQSGSYEGALVIQGSARTLRVPYLYVVGDGVPANVFPLLGYGVNGNVNEDDPDGGVVFRVVDQYGVGVPNVPVRFAVSRGGGRISNADTATDSYGIGGANATFGPSPGAQQFVGTAAGMSVPFDVVARVKPTINAGGVVSAASFTAGPGATPGSLISLFGTGLSDFVASVSTPYLPVDLATVGVSFDVPSASLSVPGHLVYVSPQQVNLQVPWELAGQTSAQIKVTISESNGQVTTIPLATYAPGVFEYIAPGGARLAAALDAGFHLLTAANPARRGQDILIYCTGLGPVDQPQVTGELAPSQTLVNTTVRPTVSIGGQPATVSFSGLAPGFAGLYQVNVTVPPNAPTGTEQVVLSIGGVTAKTSSLPVQ